MIVIPSSGRPTNRPFVMETASQVWFLWTILLSFLAGDTGKYIIGILSWAAPFTHIAWSWLIFCIVGAGRSSQVWAVRLCLGFTTELYGSHWCQFFLSEWVKRLLLIMSADLWVSSQRWEKVLSQSFSASSICPGMSQYIILSLLYGCWWSADDRCLHQGH